MGLIKILQDEHRKVLIERKDQINIGQIKI